MTTVGAVDLLDAALDEVGAAARAALISEATSGLCDALSSARRIAVYGVGREGLVMRAFAMRLMHLGLDAHVVGDVTTPPIGHGDLLVTSAGPGSFSTVMALLGVAVREGAARWVLTAVSGGDAATAADGVVHLPAQTMASETAVQPSSLPMGTAYEIALLCYLDVVVSVLAPELGETLETMSGRHTNLE